jgi:hypothetical protein
MVMTRVLPARKRSDRIRPSPHRQPGQRRYQARRRSAEAGWISPGSRPEDGRREWSGRAQSWFASWVRAFDAGHHIRTRNQFKRGFVNCAGEWRMIGPGVRPRLWRSACDSSDELYDPGQGHPEDRGRGGSAFPTPIFSERSTRNEALRPIHSETDYEKALAEFERLWGARSGAPEGDRLDISAEVPKLRGASEVRFRLTVRPARWRTATDRSTPAGGIRAPACRIMLTQCSAYV